MGTAVESLRIALPSFFVPFAFVFNPDLLVFPKITALGMTCFLMVLLTEFYLTVALYGYFLRKLNGIERSFFAVSSAMMMYSLVWHRASAQLLAIFIGIGAVGIFWILVTKHRTVSVTQKRVN